MAGHDIHPAQALCLRELAHRDGISQSELAERLNVTRPTVTVMVQKMEQAGLLERRVDQTDQRFTRIYLTEEGKRMHMDARRRIEEVLTRTIEPLPEKDQVELERLLNSLASNVEAALAETDLS
jgi:DNA-binding MarR family transcriptional regulator